MSDVSDIEKLLAAHKRHVAFISWLKAGLVAVCSAIGAFFGAGWVARGYLEQLATKDQVAAITAGQKSITDDLEKREGTLDNRITVVEEHDRSQDKVSGDLRTDVRELQSLRRYHP